MHEAFRLPGIRYRLMGLTFLLLLLTVLSLIWLANWQMEGLFREYLSQNLTGIAAENGMHEMNFLHSVHQSLLWVGLLFVLLGLAASYWLARSITQPLRRLSLAVEAIGDGKLGGQVPVPSRDEVGQLAGAFNAMSLRLAGNEQLRREFLANIAHELRTPLAILHGNLESMLDGVVKPDMERLFSMQEEVMRLTRLVADLRDLSLAEVHQLELHKERTQVNALIERAAAMLEPLLEEKRLRCCSEFAENLPELELDQDRINQVLYNVLVNAIRYTRPDSQLLLSTHRLAEGIGIMIADEGTGIAAADLPHVFDYFYRGDKSRSRQSGGSGIGLALARQFVENHGGSIRAENRPEGGTAIHIFLPFVPDI